MAPTSRSGVDSTWRAHQRCPTAEQGGCTQAAGIVWGWSDSAGALLVAAGGNPDRLRSNAAFSMLCGASPIQASSGKTQRHRLNRGGDRQANAALYRIVIARLRHDQQTKDYLDRRIREGKSKKEAIRCLKRYVAREVFAVLRP
jgi:transposase